MAFRCATRNPWGNSAKYTWFAIEFYPWSWHWKYNEFLTHLNFLVCSFNKSLFTEIKQQARLTVARVCTGSHTTWVLVQHPIKAVSAVANLHQVRRLTSSVPVLKGSRNSHGRTTCHLFSQAFSPRSFVNWKTQDLWWWWRTHAQSTESVIQMGLQREASGLCSRDSLCALELMMRFLQEQSESTWTFFSCPWQAQCRNLS